MTNEHPCPPPEPKWWASMSEERLGSGPCDTKEGAIAEALHAGEFIEIDPDDENPDWRVSMWVGEYQHKHVNLAQYFDAKRFIDDAYEPIDENGEGADEDGERHPLEELSTDDIEALESAVRQAIWTWQHDRKIPLKSWWVEAVSGHEPVTLPHPNNDQS
ncbi:hypothetical protein PXK30_03575 [Phaeobacter gallaeciensis]|uniref:hypothetical protein n=1 Tax=Phaeobacter gallaeciensis TaxID=60890 RepID=UPI00237F9892|nr:hypothetical protein [Phaeobacter gallaeciensis]MDE4303988.1 hypothetical protein [Phaeobacter gallaeciensis]MDE4309048.1 hypothetical protein [Phaeobacter gallaeciensis]MDE4313398.1 hypothetical protein [Phaeobacter gallaeciensis]MDE4317977.1 hypothetical protein [Phaeobacter gallaeciensis]MDE4322440.1 hypothetical protein [Phaeobacter gallaeciensis]